MYVFLESGTSDSVHGGHWLTASAERPIISPDPEAYAGLIFWLTRKKLSGSYLALINASLE